jgi:enoyl-[acyl-carrier protein] reductase I
MYSIDLKGKKAVVFGVANHRSIAWNIASILDEAGASIILTYQNERFQASVSKLAATLSDGSTIECDVSKDENVAATFAQIKERFDTIDILIHSIAFANRDDLGGSFLDTSRDGFRLALDISAYSLIPIAREAVSLMANGGSILTMTFYASTRYFPGYNVMGTAKAALEHVVRQLAGELGQKNIRVNAISAGPLDTLAARGIPGFITMKQTHAEHAPLRRNVTHMEVAQTALYLCSDLSSAVTGAVIPVDTGFHIVAM